MDSIGLSSLVLEVKDRRNLHVKLPLDAFDGHNDLLDVLYEYLKGMKSVPERDDNAMKFSTVRKVLTVDRFVKGVFETGEYGYRVTYRDVDNNKDSYISKIREAGMLPFYFLMFLPEGREKAIVLLQRFKQFGIQEVLLGRFQAYFTQKFHDYYVDVSTLTNTNIINEYIQKARLTQIKFIQFQWPSDLADEVAQLNPKQRPGYIETIVHAAYASSLPYKERLMKHINGKLSLDKVVEAKIPYNNIKFVMNVGGKQRTLDLGNASDFRSNYDVTDEVTLDEGRHPVFDSIDAVALGLLDTLSDDLYKGKVRT